jgi:hypothetical protein
MDESRREPSLAAAKKNGNHIFVFRADGRGKDARSFGSITVIGKRRQCRRSKRVTRGACDAFKTNAGTWLDPSHYAGMTRSFLSLRDFA